MKNLFPFIISFFLPGAGQFILKDYTKGGIIFFINVVLIFLLLFTDFLNFIPFWFPSIILMIWSVFDVYDKIVMIEGRKSATRYLAFSLIIVVVVIPMILLLFATGLFKGAEFLTDEYLNEDRTKTEMNKIATELELYQNHLGYYPKSYESFISQKPIWTNWNSDSWKIRTNTS